MSKQSVDFKCRFDPGTGLFQLEIKPGVWTVGIEIERIGRLIKDEAGRRSAEGKERDNTIPVFKVLSEALLNAPAVKKIPAKGDRAAQRLSQQQELEALLGLD